MSQLLKLRKLSPPLETLVRLFFCIFLHFSEPNLVQPNPDTDYASDSEVPQDCRRLKIPMEEKDGLGVLCVRPWEGQCSSAIFTANIHCKYSLSDHDF